MGAIRTATKRNDRQHKLMNIYNKTLLEIMAESAEQNSRYRAEKALHEEVITSTDKPAQKAVNRRYRRAVKCAVIDTEEGSEEGHEKA